MHHRKYIIHIGQPKTGTTALQIALSTNRRRLLRQGFLYPRPAFGPGHGGLTVPFAHRVQRAMTRHFGQDLEKARMTALDQWRAVAAEAARAPDATLLLSSEHFLAAPGLDLLPGLIEEMLGPGGKIGFVVYLRTPSEHYVSRVQQQIKATHRLPPPAHERLARLEQIEQIAPVLARKFARDSLTEGDIVADFCALNGIDSSGFRRRTAGANTSLSAEGMILLQEYHRRHHADSPHVAPADINRLMQAIAAGEAACPGQYTRPRVRPEFAQWLDRETPVLAGLRHRYGFDLVKDHGVPEGQMRDPSGLRDVAELVGFDPAALARLRSTVGL